MTLEEIVVTSRSNDRLSPDRQKLILPYDIEMSSNTGIKALHQSGVEVYYSVLPSHNSDFKIKLSRTIFSVVLTFDSKHKCEAEGFKI